MLRSCRTTILLALLAIVPAGARAQVSTTGSPRCDSACVAHSSSRGGIEMGMSMENMEMCMKMMEAGSARLDSLVTLMDRATGASKVDAMGRVIGELVGQRKAMREHMMHMHAPMPGSARKDSTAHTEHH
jgi:hypothetical protein